MNNRVSDRRRKPRAKAIETQGRWKIFLLMFMFAAILVTGFFFAGRQHFSSINYGMKNSSLRKQLDTLETEKRRLLLAREVSLSPVEIKKAARKLGITGPERDDVQLASLVKTDKPMASVSPALVKTTGGSTPTYSMVSASFSSAPSRTAKPETAGKPAPADRLRQVSKNDVAALVK